MMKKAASFLLVAFLLAGCDGYRDFAGPEGEPVIEGPDDPMVQAGTYKVTYNVIGTYASCTIAYVSDQKKLILRDVASFPWEHSFEVAVSRSTGPFEAKISATCADPSKLGKSTVHLLVGEAVKARASAVGFGATSEVEYPVGTP